MRYKLVGSCIRNDDKIKAEVGLKLVNEDDTLYSINGKNKGVKYKTDTIGELVIIGALCQILGRLVNSSLSFH
ncbi:hypothetical protein [Peptoniphilus porci]|uniref:Homoserine dehydrogenase catalytic domain-containing protein n=1 Tax=Peptoniphilus porci TaxID=2652280 RepID=A0A1U7LZR4_9FIRM|nr:hypothetical protein BIV18_04950 [Peptoniphilus porci]